MDDGIKQKKGIAGYEIVGDRSPEHPDDGYLTLHRLTVRTVFDDETRSAPYPCEFITREGVDAVCVVIYARTGDGIQILLRGCARPPAFFRKRRNPPVPDEAAYRTVTELVAGVLEDQDDGLEGVRQRAAIEVFEEAGFKVRPEDVELLGGPCFPTPGVYDEKVYFAAVQVDPEAQQRPEGDGSPMEEGASLHWLPLKQAIKECREGNIEDAKTEIALVRLRDNK